MAGKVVADARHDPIDSGRVKVGPLAIVWTRVYRRNTSTSPDPGFLVKRMRTTCSSISTTLERSTAPLSSFSSYVSEFCQSFFFSSRSPNYVRFCLTLEKRNSQLAAIFCPAFTFHSFCHTILIPNETSRLRGYTVQSFSSYFQNNYAL